MIISRTTDLKQDTSDSAFVGWFVVTLMTLAVFGPYLVGGVRTDQAAVYSLAVLALIFGLPQFSPQGGLKFLVPWSLMLLVAMLGIVFPIRQSEPWAPGGVLAGVDTLLMPLAASVTILCAVKPPRAQALLQTVGRIFVLGMSLNAVLAIVDTRLDLSVILRPFWAREAATETVAMRAEAMGRLSGIINQPSSAGLAYSLAGLLAVYIYMRHPKKLYLLLTLIALGGVLTVSKVFLLVGLPLTLLYLWKSVRGGGKGGLLFAFLVAAGAVVQYGLFQRWDGLAMLTRLLDPPEHQGLISFYTAGRWAEGSPMMQVIGEVLRISPFVGVGAGGWSIAYDSSWAQAIVVAGLLGAACLLTVLFGFFRLAKITANPERRRFTYFLAALLLGASFGVPALTTNRFGVIVWIVVALLVLARQHDRAPVRAPSLAQNVY